MTDSFESRTKHTKSATPALAPSVLIFSYILPSSGCRLTSFQKYFSSFLASKCRVLLSKNDDEPAKV
ncbi:hypothetical protein FRC02_006650 [Tulasnella sp. 418]|nr:hypothetical protein FRC02_006650 [Tulasnella sp. 418]